MLSTSKLVQDHVDKVIESSFVMHSQPCEDDVISLEFDKPSADLMISQLGSISVICDVEKCTVVEGLAIPLATVDKERLVKVALRNEKGQLVQNALPIAAWIEDKGNGSIIAAWIEDKGNGSIIAAWIEDKGNGSIIAAWIEDKGNGSIIAAWIEDKGNGSIIAAWIEDKGNGSIIAAWIEDKGNGSIIAAWIEDKGNGFIIAAWIEDKGNGSIIMPRAELRRHTVVVLSVCHSVCLSVCYKHFSSLTEN